MEKKRRCAVFTIVKNEYYFLPIWLKYYKKYFADQDIYVLDHQSNDGSTDNLTVNHIPVVNEMAFDHNWLVETIENFQVSLLEKYESVIFAESDELLYSPDMPLNILIEHFLNDPSKKHITCLGHEMIQDLEKESPLEIGGEIFKNRNYWFKYPDYDKTLISKVPLKWVWGFHYAKNIDRDFSYNLHLMHLHRCDFELMLKRHEERANKWKLKGDGGGTQHAIGDREGVLKYFNKISSEIKFIPERHKRVFDGI
jgi:hypothetical protein